MSEKQDFVAALRRGLEEVESLAPSIDRPEAPGNDWNARDILAHMAFWEGRAQEFLRLVPEGREGDLLNPADAAEVDAWNERVHRENRSTSWPMALRYWTDLRRKTIKQLEAVDEELLARPHLHHSVKAQVAEDTSEHDEQHLPRLRELASVAGR
ncbi:MAG: hypothetical protein WEB00_07205 [Dehalococcoidia bacterium]